MKKFKPHRHTPHPGLLPLRGNEERQTRQLDSILNQANRTREALREKVRQALAKQ